MGQAEPDPRTGEKFAGRHDSSDADESAALLSARKTSSLRTEVEVRSVEGALSRGSKPYIQVTILSESRTPLKSTVLRLEQSQMPLSEAECSWAVHLRRGFGYMITVEGATHGTLRQMVNKSLT